MLPKEDNIYTLVITRCIGAMLLTGCCCTKRYNDISPTLVAHVLTRATVKISGNAFLKKQIVLSDQFLISRNSRKEAYVHSLILDLSRFSAQSSRTFRYLTFHHIHKWRTSVKQWDQVHASDAYEARKQRKTMQQCLISLAWSHCFFACLPFMNMAYMWYFYLVSVTMNQSDCHYTQPCCTICNLTVKT